jgi:hypothetical protein
MDTGDPWDWSIDRIVREFTTNDRSWQPHTPVMATPEPIQFEKALRENDVTGSVLLLEVNDSVMKDEFGIRSLGQRAFVRCGIEALRLRSVKYQAHIQKDQPLRIAASQQSHSAQDFLQLLRAAIPGFPAEQPGMFIAPVELAHSPIETLLT